MKQGGGGVCELFIEEEEEEGDDRRLCFVVGLGERERAPSLRTTPLDPLEGKISRVVRRSKGV